MRLDFFKTKNKIQIYSLQKINLEREDTPMLKLRDGKIYNM